MYFSSYVTGEKLEDFWARGFFVDSVSDRVFPSCGALPYAD